MKFKTLSIEDCEQIRIWRNEQLESLRTPFFLTKEQQNHFYESVVCNRQANARYWGIWAADLLIGMCGLESISWENRNAEISIIINPERQSKGYGNEAVKLLLDQGFNYLNLHKIKGECYFSNPALEFWGKIASKYNAKETVLPHEKFWDGNYFDAYRFDFIKEDWESVTK